MRECASTFRPFVRVCMHARILTKMNLVVSTYLISLKEPNGDQTKFLYHIYLPPEPGEGSLKASDAFSSFKSASKAKILVIHVSEKMSV